MEISEKQLEDLIWDAYNQENGDVLLAERGLLVDGYMLRQHNLGSHGIPDLITFDVPCKGLYKVQIIELKRNLVDANTLAQALRYKIGLMDILIHVYRVPYPILRDCWQFEIILIGSSVDSFIGFSQNFLCRDITAYQYSFDPFGGLQFKEVTYSGYKEDAFDRPNLPKGLLSDMDMVDKMLFGESPFVVPF